MGRRASGLYVYKPGDHKHLYTWRECAHCAAEYLGRVDSKSRFCSLRCSGKASGKQPRPNAKQLGHLVCMKCGAEKPEHAFSKHSQSPSGRKPRCKACSADDWLAARTPEALARMRENGKRLWLTEPEKMRARARVNVARWRAANPHAARAVYHRRRARKRLGTIVGITDALLDAKWLYWAGLCWMCGKEAIEWDHVKPLSKGGAHCLANLRPACRSCNRHKSAKWPYQPS